MQKFANLKIFSIYSLKTKKRIDALLVDRQFFPTRALAQANLIAGNVICEGLKITKPGHMVLTDSHISLKEKLKYVSRGGYKLERSLEAFDLEVGGSICLDIGSSTGGFTDCLLQKGAKKIYSIDTGTNQLVYSLRMNPKVAVFENTNARYLDSETVPEKIDLCVMDVSFISVLKILPSILELLEKAGKIIILIKPQFEGTREMLSKGGIVKKKEYHITILENLLFSFKELGLSTKRLIPSPILGRKGNREYLCLLTREKQNSVEDESLFSISEVVALAEKNL